MPASDSNVILALSPKVHNEPIQTPLRSEPHQHWRPRDRPKTGQPHLVANTPASRSRCSTHLPLRGPPASRSYGCPERRYPVGNQDGVPTYWTAADLHAAGDEATNPYDLHGHGQHLELHNAIGCSAGVSKSAVHRVRRINLAPIVNLGIVVPHIRLVATRMEATLL